MNNVLKGTISTTGTMTGNLSAVFGKDGKSAYEVAVKHGFEGTEEAWLWSLRGRKGDKGDTGEQGIQGVQGVKGDKGDKGDTGNPGIYLGSGDMPEDCNVQIDPEGTPLNLNDYVTNAKYVKHLKEFSDLNDAVIVLSGNKADKSNVYTKTETDAAINAGDEALANQLGNLLDEMGSFIEEQYYRKSETDALLKHKADKTTTEATLAQLSFDMLSKASFENIMALDAKIGNIELALDELHNYATSLIGGEA